MATYIVGDIHGCFDELMLLMQKVNFDPKQDALYCTGDLVARGKNSLEVLRWLKAQGDAVKTVLGNHDLHLFSIYLNNHQAKPTDNLYEIFKAPDCEELLTWLRHQSLCISHPDFLLCHAGISPEWSEQEATQAALSVEKTLQSDHWQTLITQMYGDTPTSWKQANTIEEQHRYAINSLTRMRFCYSDGSLNLTEKRSLDTIKHTPNANMDAWFNLIEEHQLNKTVIFGHWAALEGYEDDKVIGLDTGCVWGGSLTALRWDDKRYFSQPALSNAR